MRTSKKQPVFKNTNNHEARQSWDGKTVEILGIVVNPNDNEILEPVEMPQFLVRLNETGEVDTALVEQIDEEFWGCGMKVTLEGLEAWRKGNTKTSNPYSCDLAKYFDYGQGIAECKYEQLHSGATK